MRSLNHSLTLRSSESLY